MAGTVVDARWNVAGDALLSSIFPGRRDRLSSTSLNGHVISKERLSPSSAGGSSNAGGRRTISRRKGLHIEKQAATSRCAWCIEMQHTVGTELSDAPGSRRSRQGRRLRITCGAATQVQERASEVGERNGTPSVQELGMPELLTGGTVDFSGATNPLIKKALQTEKTIVMVRHGLSTWNYEGRVQGSSDQSTLSETGVWQAERCREALSKLDFEQCFASPISRAKTSAEVIWQERKEPLIFLDSLREANLNFLEGMKNSEAAELYPELFTSWRQDPMHFEVGGVFPVRDLWNHAQNAWEDILTQATGDLVLVVAHKSVLRAMLCTALGMGPDRFRAIDINNGGISVFTINTRGEPMLKSLNLTSHLHADGVFYQL